MKHPRAVASLLSLAALALALPAAQATTIFTHTFDEGAGGLDGTTVDGGTVSASWVAAPGVTADGAFAGRGSATLAFAPSQGTQYQLDATILNVTGDGNWVALGFANGQSTGSATGNRFTSQAGAAPEGRAWMMTRGDNSTNPNRVFTEGSSGTSADWTGTIASANGGDFNLRILLDTTGGAGTWTATWFAKRPTDGSYTEVVSSTLLPNESIDSVGFAMSATTGISADLQTLTLTQIPEPSVALLGALGFFALLRRR